MAAELETNKISLREWLSGNTEFGAIKNRLFDAPEEGFSAWARTTGGVVAFLFVLQFLTGVLLAFHYVPSAENAWTTVAFIEQSVSAGAWIRSLHYHSSVLLPLFLLAHLAQMIFRNSFQKNPFAWTFGLIFLALVLAAGATGYALPWDARSLNGVNIAASLAGNTPLIGETLQNWLQNGETISTMTISRFYGLHVFATPALILLGIAARIFIFGKNGKPIDTEKFRRWSHEQLVRNAIVVGLVFLGLAVFSAKFPAPLAPAAADAGASFLPRPGPQFLWLFEMQKYTEGWLAAILAFGLPALILGGLMLIPRFGKRVKFNKYAVSTLFAVTLLIIGGLTATAYFQDAGDVRIAEQLAKQEKAENDFRLKTFQPKVIQIGKREGRIESKTENSDSKSAPISTEKNETVEIPKSYTANCAKCHGANGEGKGVFPELKGLTIRAEEKRSDEDLLQIINNPSSFGLSSKMPSYEHKLTEEQKQEIIRWIKTLK